MLDSEKDTLHYDIRLDRLLLIHTCHNYIEAINLCKSSTQSESFEEKTGYLNNRLKENEKLYVFDFDAIKIKSEERFREKLEENSFFNIKENYFGTVLEWLSKVIDSITYSSLFEDFWHKIVTEFTIRREKFDYKISKGINSDFEIRVYNHNITSMQELKVILLEEFEKILIQREKVLDEILVLFEKDMTVKIKGKILGL